MDYRDDIYYAVLLLRGPSGLISVDCRPSDGIALALRASVPIRVKSEVFEKAAREQEPGSIHPATRHQAGSDAATDMARTADARKEADTLAALLAKGAVPEDLGEAAGPERLRDLLLGPGARIAEQDVESIVPGGLCCNISGILNESR